jgi:tellurite resistance protein
MPNMDVNIGRDTLIALAAIAWADGAMDPKEAAGIRSAAKQLSLSADDARALEEALGRRTGLEEVETVRMSRLTRLFTYAVANWVAQLDGALSEQETAALGLLGDRLGLSVVARERARTVALAQAGDAAYDLVKLRAKLSSGLSQIGNE